MKKRILSLLLAAVLLFALLPRSVLPVSAEQPRKLLEIRSFWGDEDPTVTHLHYDEDTGLLERISFSGYDYEMLDYFYYYDDCGRLIQITSGDKEEDFYSYVNLELHYDDQGRLKSWDDFSVYYGDIYGDCIYKKDGTLLRTAAQYTYSVDCLYVYDDDGRLAGVEKTDFHIDGPIVTITAFVYDKYGRVCQRIERVEDDEPVATAYSYPFADFVVEESYGSYTLRYDAGLLPQVDPYLRAMLQEWSFSPLTFYVGEDARVRQSGDYLLSITDTVNQGKTQVRTEFVYESTSGRSSGKK